MRMNFNLREPSFGRAMGAARARHRRPDKCCPAVRKRRGGRNIHVRRAGPTPDGRRAVGARGRDFTSILRRRLAATLHFETVNFRAGAVAVIEDRAGGMRTGELAAPRSDQATPNRQRASRTPAGRLVKAHRRQPLSTRLCSPFDCSRRPQLKAAAAAPSDARQFGAHFNCFRRASLEGRASRLLPVRPAQDDTPGEPPAPAGSIMVAPSRRAQI